MAARLGNVLYWLGCAVGLVFFAGGYVLISSGGYRLQAFDYVLVGTPAVVAWLIGRALRYVLAGT
jgi:hypothetical protein